MQVVCSSLYPGLISGLNVVWVVDWEISAVASEAENMLSDELSLKSLDTNTRLETVWGPKH